MSGVSRNLCLFYGLIALAALVATWSQNLQYGGGASPMQYLLDLKASPASRSFTLDIGFFLLAGAVLMVAEARRLEVRWVWLYVIFGFIVAISVTFPLFLIAREWRLAKIGAGEHPMKLTTSDLIGLGLLTLVVLAFSGFILT
jgi:Terpene cyclase DEP1